MLGVDGGGTATRAVVRDPAGREIGRGIAAGCNPNTRSATEAAAEFGTAVRQALTGLDPARLGGAVLGLAGYRRYHGDAQVAAAFDTTWRTAVPRLPLTVLPDCTVAFATGTAEPDGTVLVAGTGAIAARITAREVGRMSGGWGWLLGDEGSAFWVGREAVRATLTTLDGGPRGALAEAVLAATGTTHTIGLISLVNAGLPVELARFAPLVGPAAAAGDPAAQLILRTAVAQLTRLALATREPGERGVFVLTGGLLGTVGAGLSEALAPHGPVYLVPDGAAGAAWLAALEVFGPDAPHPGPAVNQRWTTREESDGGVGQG